MPGKTTKGVYFVKKKHSLGRRSRGQALLEYVIIIAVVAIAALTVLYAFSDQIRAMFSGATEALGGNVADDATQSSEEIFKSIGDDYKP